MRRETSMSDCKHRGPHREPLRVFVLSVRNDRGLWAALQRMGCKLREDGSVLIEKIEVKSLIEGWLAGLQNGDLRKEDVIREVERRSQPITDVAAASSGKSSPSWSSGRSSGGEERSGSPADGGTWSFSTPVATFKVP